MPFKCATQPRRVMFPAMTPQKNDLHMEVVLCFEDLIYYAWSLNNHSAYEVGVSSKRTLTKVYTVGKAAWIKDT